MEAGSSSCVVVNGMPSLGLRVIVVDGDIEYLRQTKKQLEDFGYKVTTCFKATIALSLLRKKNRIFDIVVTDVHMPVMDGFQLLELVGLEMDLPVIMVSADGSTDVMVKGLENGACDYLVKPVKKEELRKIWKHVFIKREQVKKEDGFPYRKRRGRSENNLLEKNYGTKQLSKKSRFVWSKELHDKFVGAVNTLGIDRAVPLKIKDLMNVSSIKRDTISSHLQKYKLYLMRLGKEAQKNGLIKPNGKVGKLGIDFIAIAGSKEIPREIAALSFEISGRTAGRSTVPTMDQQVPQQVPVQEPSFIPERPGTPFDKSPMNSEINLSNGSIPAQITNQQQSASLPQQSASETNTSNGSIPTQMVDQQQSASLRSENHRENREDHAALHFPYQSPSNLQGGSHQFESPPNFQPVNSPVPHEHNSNNISLSPKMDWDQLLSPKVDWDQFLSLENDIQVGQETEEIINSFALLNDDTFNSTFQTEPTSTEINGTWPVLPSDLNVCPPSVSQASPNLYNFV